MLEAQQNEHQVLKIDIRGNITKFAMVIEMAGIFLLFQIGESDHPDVAAAMPKKCRIVPIKADELYSEVHIIYFQS